MQQWGSCSWYDFAVEINEGKNDVAVAATTSSGCISGKGQRDRTTQGWISPNPTSGFELPTWQDALRRYLLGGRVDISNQTEGRGKCRPHCKSTHIRCWIFGGSYYSKDGKKYRVVIGKDTRRSSAMFGILWLQDLASGADAYLLRILLQVFLYLAMFGMV